MTYTSPPQKKTGDKPALYLVYLIFLFIPWLFNRPALIDITVALVATAIYIPLHFACFNAKGTTRLYYIAVIVALGISAAPFVNSYSVFHIYAAAMSGYIRPVRTAGIALGLCIIAYIASGLYFERFFLEITIGLIISIVIWVSTFSTAETIAVHEQAERERSLETQQASLVERERIARDLHDLLGHTLTLVALKADLAKRLIDTDIDRAKAEIDSIQTSSRQALSDVRATLSGLTSTSVKEELKNGENVLTAAGIELRIQGQSPVLSEERDTAIGLMVREAVTNIVRHSSATRVFINFEHTDHSFAMTVSDNGAPQNFVEGNGLSGLRKRLEALGGAFSVTKTDGIQLHARLPV